MAISRSFRADIDQIPIGDTLRFVEEGLDRAPVSDGVPIAPVDTIVVMKLLAGRTQDLADVEAIAGSGVDRESLRAAVQRVLALLTRFPRLGQPVRGSVRRMMLSRFPYCIYYRLLTPDTLRVLAVAHNRRRPEYWASRR